MLHRKIDQTSLVSRPFDGKRLVTNAEWARELAREFGSRWFTEEEALTILSLLELEKRGLVERRVRRGHTEWRARPNRLKQRPAQSTAGADRVR